MLGEALSYPRRGDDWLKTILIGGVLSILGIFLIPAIPLQGYYVRVLRSAAVGDETPPSFDDWGRLFVDGLKVLVVALAYLAVPYIVFFTGAVLSGGSDSGAAIGLLLVVVGSVLVVLAGYILPVALTNFALEDRLGAAFDIGTVLRAAFTGRYFVAVVLAVVVGGILSIVASLLTLLIIGIFLLFYLQVAIYYLMGLGCAPKLRGQQGAEAVAD